MSRETWRSVATGAFATLGGALGVGFPLAFNPGWANEWPFGLSIDQVWSAGLSLVVCVTGTAVTLGLGAVAVMARSRAGSAVPGKGAFVVLALCSAAAGVAAGV